jgi:ATP-dependent RNA helicase DDX35
VVATNAAEVSPSFDGVVYVIDCMFAKIKGYNPIVNLDCLLAAPISKDTAVTRAGQAGWERPGHCFRLCTQEAFEVWALHTMSFIVPSGLTFLCKKPQPLG